MCSTSLRQPWMEGDYKDAFAVSLCRDGSEISEPNGGVGGSETQLVLEMLIKGDGGLLRPY